MIRQQPNLLSQKGGSNNPSRVHVLGVIEDKKCILYSVATSKTTEIQLFNQYGISTTVIAFNKYMDIISADMSFDVEMLIYTERIIIPSPNNSKRNSNYDNLFKYQTVLCSINSFSKLQVFNDYNPITSYFLPYIEDNKFTSNFDFYKTNNQSFNDINNQKNDALKSYQFIHVIGDKVSHFRATIRKQKIYIKMINNGININKCQKWFFSKRDMTFYSFNEGKFSAYTILNDQKKGPTVVVDSFAYKNDSSSVLPDELALKPSTLTNLPCFRFSSGISYVVKINNGNKVDYGIIEQLYKGEESFLTFSVATIYGKFKNVVTVKGIQPDLPISFLTPLSNYNAVFVFVPNCFISFVDFSYPNPHISMMPHIFNETSFSSQIVSNIDPEINFLSDLNSGKVFEVSLNIESFPKSLHFADRTILSIISRLVATFSAQVSITSAIESLPLDTSHVQFFFKSVFSIINQIFPAKNFQLIEKSENYSFHESNNFFSKINLPRTESDPTNNIYFDELAKEDFPFSSSLKKNSTIINNKSKINKFDHQNRFYKISSKTLDESSNSVSSSSSNYSILSDKISIDDKSKHLSMMQSKDYLELTNSVIEKSNFVKLIHDNIELLFSSGKICETRIFLISISACFEAMRAKMPESSIFFNECSERSFRFCPLTIRQPFAINGLVNYKYKSINQTSGYEIRKLDSCEGSNSKNNDNSKKNFINIINNTRKNEQNQILYWKKKLCFLNKDESFFEKKKSTSLKKRTKSNIYIDVSNYDSNITIDKSFDNKQKRLVVDNSNDDEKPVLITIPYVSRRRSSLSIRHACVEKTTYF